MMSDYGTIRPAYDADNELFILYLAARSGHTASFMLSPEDFAAFVAECAGLLAHGTPTSPKNALNQVEEILKKEERDE